jgi:hypothetical protein
MPRKKINPRTRRPKSDGELNPISVWKISDNRTYGMSIRNGKGTYIDTEREFSGPQIDAVREAMKKAKHKWDLSKDWKPFLRSIGVSI